ncbi:MAG: hypothetical protein N2652_05365 [Kiritimatiellae bacterium]|nr:hypothetical protein [Kiritimatiellia bacterium]
MSAGEFSGSFAVNGMVWLAGFAPGSLALQWHLGETLWTELRAASPSGTLALILRRQEGPSTTTGGALTLLGAAPAGFRRLEAAPGTYDGEFGWLDPAGEFTRLAQLGPARPLPAAPAVDISLALMAPSGASVGAALQRMGKVERAASVTWIRRPQAFARVCPALPTNPVPAGSSFPPIPATPPVVGEAGPAADWTTNGDEPAPAATAGQAWRASGGHQPPPEVGWPTATAANTLGVI